MENNLVAVLVEGRIYYVDRSVLFNFLQSNSKTVTEQGNRNPDDDRQVISD